MNTDDVVKKQFMQAADKVVEYGYNKRIFSDPYFYILISLFVLVYSLSKENTKDSVYALTAQILIALGSLAPPIIGYPGAHTVSDTAVSFGGLIFAILFFSVSYVVAKGKVFARLYKMGMYTIKFSR